MTTFLGTNIVQTAMAANEAAKSASEAAAAGDYSGIKGLAGQASSTSKDNFTTTIQSNESFSPYGGEDDRAYNSNHESLKDGGSDAAFDINGNVFKNQISGDTESAEGKSYRLLNDISKEPGYHTRNSDNEKIGSSITLLGEDNSLIDEYNKMSSDMSKGAICRIEVVQPEIKEEVVVKKEYTCEYSDSPVYDKSSCSVERTFSIPGAASGTGLTLAKSVGTTHTTHTGSFVYPHAVAFDKQLKFKLERSDIMSASLTYAPIASNQSIKVNGHVLGAVTGGDISSFLKDGENIIEASCSAGKLLPSTTTEPMLSEYYGSEITSFCSTQGNGVLDGVLVYGDMRWSSAGNYVTTTNPADSRSNTGACPSGYLQVGYDDNHQRAKHYEIQSVKRCFKQYDEPQCMAVSPSVKALAPASPSQVEYLHWYSVIRKLIVNPGPADPHNFNWPNRSQAQNDGSEVIPLVGTGGVSGKADNRWVFIHSNGNVKYTGSYYLNQPQYHESINEADACYNSHRHNGQSSNGPCRIPSLKGSLGAYEQWRNAGIFPQYSNNAHALNSVKYAKGCGHAQLNVNLRIQHVNAVEKVTQTPQNCVAGNNQMVVDGYGNYHYGLQGRAFKYTDSATPPSTDFWRCDSSSPNKAHGTYVTNQATMGLVKNTMLEMFPGDKQGNDVCYKAVAPAYAVDVTAEGCTDGTLGCWGSGFDPDIGVGSNSKVEDDAPLIVKVLSRITVFNKAHAAITGPTLGDAYKENSCGVYSENNACRYVSDSCLYTNAYTGECQLYSRKYECDEVEEKIIQEAIANKVCEGYMPCASDGDEYCTYEDDGSMDDFKKAAVLLSVAQFSDNDTSCLDPEDISTCNMFNGRRAECSTKKSSLNSHCCDKPSGAPGPLEYVKVLYAAYKTTYVQNSLASLGSTITGSGMWSNYITPIGESISAGWGHVVDFSKTAYDAVANKFKDWFVSETTAAVQQTTVNAVSGMAGEAASSGIMTSIGASANFFGARMAEMMGNILGDWFVQDVIRNEVTGAIVEYVAEGAVATATEGQVASTAINQGLANAVGSVVTVVGWVYLAYSMAKIAKDILTKCSDSEFRDAYSIASDSCYQVKNEVCTSEGIFGCTERYNYYCCFNSMLGRIIHEQARLSGQLSKDWNETYEGGCPGIAFDDFAGLDFNKIDLSEWVDALVQTGQLPGEDAAAKAAFTDIDNLTRNISKLQDDFEADPDKYDNALERTQEVLDTAGGDFEAYRDNDREMLIISSQYEQQTEDCDGRYMSDDENGYDTYRGYVIYADGSKKYLGPCAIKPDAGVYPIQTESCSYTEGKKTKDGTSKFFIGRYGEKVRISDCK